MCAELQCRYITRVFRGEIETPPLEEQHDEMLKSRNTLAAQYIDRQQLRVQHGLDFRYYNDLAHEIGCYATPWKLLTERPTAFWHAFFTSTGQIRNRLVGPGRLESAELWAEERHKSRHSGRYQGGTGELDGSINDYDHNPLAGELKNGDGLGPVNRRSWGWPAKTVRNWLQMGQRLRKLGAEGNVVGPLPYLQPPQRIDAHYDQNLRRAESDGLRHSTRFGEEAIDGYLDQGGEKGMVWKDRASRADGGLVAADEVAEEAVATP